MLNSTFTKMYGLRTYGYNQWVVQRMLMLNKKCLVANRLKGYAGRFVRQHIK